MVASPEDEGAVTASGSFPSKLREHESHFNATVGEKEVKKKKNLDSALIGLPSAGKPQKSDFLKIKKLHQI